MADDPADHTTLPDRAIQWCSMLRAVGVKGNGIDDREILNQR